MKINPSRDPSLSCTSLLDDKDLTIMLALIEQPLATDSQIQEMVSSKLDLDLSIATINRRVHKMTDSGVIHGAIPQLRYEYLDMRLHSFVTEVSPDGWRENLEIVKNFCDAHPYTIYQNTIFGNKNGLFCQFILPEFEQKALTDLISVFDEFIHRSIISDYEHFPIQPPSKSYQMRLETWDQRNRTWDVNTDELERVLSISGKLVSRSKVESRSVLDQMKKLDFIILRELTRNSRRSQAEILKFVKDEDPERVYQDYFSDKTNPGSKQTFSRRYNFLLTQNIISEYRLAYDRTLFGIFNQALYIGHIDLKKLSQLELCIENGYLPFPNSLSYSDNHFLFWINLPPVEMVQFPEILASHFKGLKFFMFGRSPSRYLLWHQNFDQETNYWKISEEWTVKQPLSAIGL